MFPRVANIVHSGSIRIVISWILIISQLSLFQYVLHRTYELWEYLFVVCVVR